jgi:predicted transcriptional regulator
MSKAVLMSIQPKWCENIASGKKTVEVRKTKPKLETPFKVYIYCTKNKNGIANCKGNEILDGKVIGEFVCDYITSFKAMGEVQALWNETQNTCLSHDEIIKYANGKRLYYLHISNLVIYDKPKDLSEFRYYNASITTKYGFPIRTHEIRRPPQSWCYVEACVLKDEIKPCPFCGGRPKLESYEPSRFFSWRWGFKHTCRGGSGDDKRICIYASGFDTEKEAVEVWNRRADNG